MHLLMYLLIYLRQDKENIQFELEKENFLLANRNQ